MKKSIFILAMFTTMFFFSCKKFDELDVNFSENNVSSGKMNIVDVKGLEMQVAASNYWQTRNNPGFPSHWFNNFILPKGLSPQSVSFTESNILRLGVVISFPFGRTSENGQFSLIGQADGNLLVRRNSTGQVLWASNSTQFGSFPGRHELRFQTDGNLVIYKIWSPFSEEAAWATYNLQLSASLDRSKINSDNTFYLIQNDGNFVLYRVFSEGTQPVAETQTNNKVSSHWGTIK